VPVPRKIIDLWNDYRDCHWLIQAFALFGFIDFVFLVLRVI
jgi:hypothetical protein